ncbi:unnamed protein product [Vitrella brassicaformis CCMP3155]|uniref:PH domain-containing protein n=4 Tax=Vitrella brassicaformis TaxID=1169539 RepID=A0A0G4G7Z2_VITBC|nr:unnamed protein product [Vitrella brassicaformis CCMP3155]|eukprot:CEM24780.1 unnamed protein product [Vitrella brassicaformis CCMP3155]
MSERVSDYTQPPPPTLIPRDGGGPPCCACNEKGTSALSTCSRRCDCRNHKRLCTNCVNCKRGTCTNFAYPADPAVCDDDDDESDAVSPSAGPAVPSTASFVDEKMREAFGEPLVNSAGGPTFPEWEAYHERVCQLRLRCVKDLSKLGNLGRAIADAIADEVEKISKLEAPSERAGVFVRTLIQRDPDVKRKRDVKRMLWRRLEMWQKGQVEELVCEAERLDQQFPTTQPQLDDASVYRIFNKLMLEGKVRAAVRFVTERGGGGVLHPSAQAEERPPGVTVLDVLREKHPPQQQPHEEAFLPCDDLPPLIDVDITDSTVERAARSLSGSAGPTGGDANFWQTFLLRYALRRIGPSYGYHPETAKSFLVVKPELEQIARELFEPEGVQIVTGKRFLGGYVGDEGGRAAFLCEKVEGWVRGVRALTSAARNFPHTAHAAMTRSLQMEWDYVFRVVLTDECALSPLREAIAKELLPALLGGPVTPSEVDLMLLPARHGGTGIRDPLDRAAAAYPASRASTKVVSKSVQGKAPFHPGDHRATIRHALTRSKQQQDVAHKTKREAALPHIDRRRHRVLSRSAEYKTSGWLTTLPSTDNNTGLDAAEFRDALNMRYGRHPPGLAARCDHCNQPLTVDHALCCKRYGLVIRRHDELRDTFAELIGMAWGDAGVRREVVLKEGEEGEGGVRADIVARGVWERQAAASFDICITDPDATSYASKNRSTKSILKQHETAKKKKYRSAVCDSRVTFCPLVVTCDGVWGHDANVFIAHMAHALLEKEGWKGRGFSHVITYPLRVYCHPDNTYYTLHVPQHTTATQVCELLLRKKSLTVSAAAAKHTENPPCHLYIVTPGHHSTHCHQLAPSALPLAIQQEVGASSLKFLLREDTHASERGGRRSVTVPEAVSVTDEGIGALRRARTDALMTLMTPQEGSGVGGGPSSPPAPAAAAAASPSRDAQKQQARQNGRVAASGSPVHHHHGAAEDFMLARDRMESEIDLSAVQEKLEKGLRTGWLEKLSKDGTQWKVRHVILQPDGVWYCKDPHRSRTRVCIPLSDCEKVLEVPEDKRIFHLVTSSRHYFFRVKTSGDRDGWLVAIAKQAALIKEQDLLVQAERSIMEAEVRRANRQLDYLASMMELDGTLECQESRQLLLDFVQNIRDTSPREWPAGFTFDDVKSYIMRYRNDAFSRNRTTPSRQQQRPSRRHSRHATRDKDKDRDRDRERRAPPTPTSTTTQPLRGDLTPAPIPESTPASATAAAAEQQQDHHMAIVMTATEVPEGGSQHTTTALDEAFQEARASSHIAHVACPDPFDTSTHTYANDNKAMDQPNKRGKSHSPTKAAEMDMAGPSLVYRDDHHDHLDDSGHLSAPEEDTRTDTSKVSSKTAKRSETADDGVVMVVGREESNDGLPKATLAHSPSEPHISMSWSGDQGNSPTTAAADGDGRRLSMAALRRGDSDGSEAAATQREVEELDTAKAQQVRQWLSSAVFPKFIGVPAFRRRLAQFPASSTLDIMPP